MRGAAARGSAAAFSPPTHTPMTGRVRASPVHAAMHHDRVAQQAGPGQDLPLKGLPPERQQVHPVSGRYNCISVKSVSRMTLPNLLALNVRALIFATERWQDNLRAPLRGKQIHEVHPVKFGGSPTDPVNKVPLSPREHAQYTRFWNQLQRDLQR